MLKTLIMWLKYVPEGIRMSRCRCSEIRENDKKCRQLEAAKSDLYHCYTYYDRILDKVVQLGNNVPDSFSCEYNSQLISSITSTEDDLQKILQKISAKVEQKINETNGYRTELLEEDSAFHAEELREQMEEEGTQPYV